MKYSDENNTKSAYDIIGYLEGCGISAERRSIYRDIEDINRIMLMLQEDIDLDEVDMFKGGEIHPFVFTAPFSTVHHRLPEFKSPLHTFEARPRHQKGFNNIPFLLTFGMV
jgi:hypothetical protein